jgi:hypothetical protein
VPPCQPSEPHALVLLLHLLQEDLSLSAAEAHDIAAKITEELRRWVAESEYPVTASG